MYKTISQIIKSGIAEEDLKNYREEVISKGISYKLYSRFIVRIITGIKKCYRIEILDDENDLKASIPSTYPVVDKGNGLLWIDLPRDDDTLIQCISDLSEAFDIKKQSIIDLFSGGSPFSCCSRFEKCSDEMKCIHPDLKYAKRCIYRTHLENNRIFYGKNRNVGV